MIWHYPDVGIKILKEEEKESTSFDKVFSWRVNYYSSLSPNIFVIDFDHTLAVYDGDRTIISEDQLPSVYTRPFMIEFLQYLKKINKNNILILWTRAKRLYINKMVLLLGIANYFDHILSREDCKKSYKKYGCYKSFRYIVNNFAKYSNMRSFLIDNLAYKNGGGEDDYFRLLSLKPYILDEVENGSDSTLLNLMLYLDKEFFLDSKKYIIPPSYNVVMVERDGSLYLGTKFDVSDCKILVKSWYPKL